MTEYNKLTVAKLKDLLRERGIPVTGLKLKAQYVEALEKADGAEDVLEDPPAEPNPEVIDQEEAIVEGGDSQPKGQSDQDVSMQTGEPEAQTGDNDVLADSSMHSFTQPEPTRPDTANGAIDERDHPAPSPIAVVGNVEINTSTAEAPARNPSPFDGASLNVTQTSTIESTATQELIEDRMKRKRRSATPPVSETEIVKKKLRQDADASEVHLKEDTPASSGAALAEDTAEQDDTVTPDVVMGQADAPTDNARDDKSGPAPKEREGRYKDLLPSSKPRTTEIEGPAQTHERATAPSVHPASSAIYVRNLQRPLNPASLRAHLAAVAAPPGAEPDPTAVRSYFVDSVKSHAFASFDSLASACRARASLHDRAWPAERDRKPLWVDFIPEERVDEWIDIERESESGGRGGSQRWEVSYDESGDGLVARLVELSPVGTSRQSQPVRRPTDVEHGQRRQVSPARRSSVSEKRPEPRRAAAPPLREAEAQKFINLDKAFRSTTAKPKLYFLPATQDLADKRLAEFDHMVSRDWSAKRAVAADEGELRRYTFEDGDVLVDSGFHPIPGRGRGRAGFAGGGPSRRGGYGRGDAGQTSYRPR